MVNFHIITESSFPIEQNLDLSDILGKIVLSKSGTVVGKVSKINLKPSTMNLEGMLINRGLFMKKIYVGKNYIDRLSNEAVILNINPSLLLKGKKVVDSEGKVIGKVTEVKRKDNSNNFQSLVVKNSSILRGKFVINAGDIKSLGYTLILKAGYNVPKNYFWNRS